MASIDLEGLGHMRHHSYLSPSATLGHPARPRDNHAIGFHSSDTGFWLSIFPYTSANSWPDQSTRAAFSCAASSSTDTAASATVPTLDALIDIAKDECAYLDRLTPDSRLHATAADTADAAIEAWEFYHGTAADIEALRAPLTNALMFVAACEYQIRAAAEIAEAAEIAAAIADGDLDADGVPVPFDRSYWVGHL
jgi:hypothetical protein